MTLKPFRWLPLTLACTLLAAMTVIAVPALAQDDGAADDASEEEMEQVDEVIVVTASRTEQRLHEVPAAISVLTADQLETLPGDDYGDLLRNLPGVNVSKMSARDVQIKTRSATNSLSASQLVLMDNRTLYLDFFGFVMWDFVPLDTREIKQIEVVNGPGSAVWGANAMTGVINLITKRPREMQGTSISLGAGDFDTLYGSITHAGVSGRLGYKVSASYYEQDPFNRPTGAIPGTAGPTNPGGTQYPAFQNQGTEQPKLNLRFDYDATDSTTWTFSGGRAETDGIIHSGIGPFDILKGSAMDFVKVDWSHMARRLTFFVNSLDGNADNLLTRGPTGAPLAFAFQSDTFNLDYSDTRVVGTKNILTYGATARKNEFDLSIAPSGDSREEKGIYLQDEILIGDKVRWLIGGRYDDIDPIDGVFSPRTSLLISPNRNHTIRFSYNQAFRAPSMINNFLDITIVNQAPLPTGPFIFASQAVGNPLVNEEQLDALEIGYVGTFGNATVTAAVYRNETTDSIDFYQAASYTGANPPLGFPLPPFVLDIPPPFGLAGLLPSVFSYRNIGETIEEGFEVAVNFRGGDHWTGFVNYSFQEEPEVSGIDPVILPNGETRFAVNTPPENRFNAGIAYDGPRFFINANANFVDDAFWTDVLDSRFYGPTDSYTQINVGAGVHLGSDDNITLSVTGTNVTDEEILGHNFGDLLEQKITGQVIVRF